MLVVCPNCAAFAEESEFCGRCGGPLPAAPGGLPFASFIAGAVRFQRGQTFESLAAELGYSPEQYEAACRPWNNLLEQDERLHVYYSFRCRLQAARAEGRAGELPERAPRLRSQVRSHKCRDCNSPKLLEARQPWVYCDLCGALFDFDYYHPRPKGELDAEELYGQLRAVCNAELAEAHAAYDRDRYHELSRWLYLAHTDLAPAAYAPRVKEPSFRWRYVDDWCAPTAVARRFDDDYQRVRAGLSGMTRGLHLGQCITLLGEYRELWDVEADLYEREGLFDRSPEQLDGRLYRRLMLCQFVGSLLEGLAGPDHPRLLEAAGLDNVHLPAPDSQPVPARCGRCGVEHLEPTGSAAQVCEYCGYLLRCGHGARFCHRCGTRVLIPEGATRARCGGCQSRFEIA